MRSPEFYLVDTNVLLVAALAEHAQHPARAAAVAWLEAFGANPEAKLIVDVESPRGHSSRLYMKPQFQQLISVHSHSSRILFEYRRKLSSQNRFLQIIADKVHDATQCVVVHVDYEGPVAVLDSPVDSPLDASDKKFIAAAINFIRHHPMGMRFRPTIVYAEDVVDWGACRLELERDFNIRLIAL